MYYPKFIVINNRINWICRKCRKLNKGSYNCGTAFCGRTIFSNKMLSKVTWSKQRKKKLIHERETYKEYLNKFSPENIIKSLRNQT